MTRSYKIQTNVYFKNSSSWTPCAFLPVFDFSFLRKPHKLNGYMCLVVSIFPADFKNRNITAVWATDSGENALIWKIPRISDEISHHITRNTLRVSYLCLNATVFQIKHTNKHRSIPCNNSQCTQPANIHSLVLSLVVSTPALQAERFDSQRNRTLGASEGQCVTAELLLT